MDFKCFMDDGIPTLSVFSLKDATTNSAPKLFSIYEIDSPKMWQYVFVIFVFLLILTLYVNNMANQNSVANTTIQLNIYDTKGGLRNLNESAKKNGNKRKFKYHVPKFMLDLYEENKSSTGNKSERPDVVRSLIPKSTGFLQDDILIEKSDENHLLIFDVPESKDDEEFLSAELKILTLVKVSSKVLFGVERIISISVYDDNSRTLLNLDKLHIYYTDNTWLTFNVTKPVSNLINTKSVPKYLKVVVSIRNFLPYRETNANLELSLMPISENFEHDYPVLLLSYKSSRGLGKVENAKRSKRNVDEDYEEETNHIWDDEYTKKVSKKLKRARNTCRRKPLYVDFAEIQYDAWIVQPSGYEAYQCQGKCFYPVADHLNPTKHAIVQALLHSVAPARASRSCCVPTKLESISVLYVDEIGVLTYRYAYNDMVVIACGCR